MTDRRRSVLGRTWELLGRVEKFGLWFLLAITITVTALLGWQRWVSATVAVPVVGGTYTEGIVASSLADIQPVVDELTKVGFVSFDASQTIVPAAAERWEVSDDRTRYTFFLHPNLSLDVVSVALDEHRDLFPEIEITLGREERQVTFQLPQPFTPFLATAATPIFPVGPYELADQSYGEIQLSARPEPLLVRPYLESISLKVYPDSYNLTQALSAGDIEGVADLETIENEALRRTLNHYTLELPRKIFLFFNTERDALKNLEIRRKLRDGQRLDGPLELTLLTLANPKNERLATEIVQQWSQLGVTVSVTTRTASELATEIVPKRDYDLLIYGLDFGADPDPYPFWHSSQISQSGLNLSNIANIDIDRTLEKARQTGDSAERTRLYEEFDRLFGEHAPAIELEHISASFGVSPSFHGLSSHPGRSVADRYNFVEAWYKKTRRQAK